MKDFMRWAIVFHTLLAAALAVPATSPYAAFLIALAFAMKEFGELKHKVPGSIKTWAKNKKMLKLLFTDLVILLQWGLPGLAALAVILL